MKIFSGSSNLPLARKIAKELGLKLSKLEIHVFPDGEKRVRVLDKMVGEDCVVVHSTSMPADVNYMELFFIIDALKRSGAEKITAVIPYLGYQRQDHIFRDGEAVSLEVVVETLQSTGVSKIITFDLHSIKIPELFKIQLIHLSALPLFAEKIGELSKGVGIAASIVKGHRQTSNDNQTDTGSDDYNENFILVSPDMGGIRRIKEVAEMKGGMPFAVVDKDRDLATGEVEAVDLEGNVRGKTAIIIDDMISTGKTIVEASKLLIERGAKKVLVFATHPVFSEDASKVLQNSPVEKVIVADTIDVPKEKQFPKLEILSVAQLITRELKK